MATACLRLHRPAMVDRPPCTALPAGGASVDPVEVVKLMSHTRRSLRLLLAVASAVVVVTGLATPAAATHNQDIHSPQAQALANIPRSSDFRWNDPARGRSFQSDLAFTGNLAIAGNYNGFRVIDIA